MTSRTKLWLGAMAGLLALALALPGPAAADRLKPYLTDGTKTTGPAAYANPDDGVCVVGVKLDGTLDINPAITNQKDCIVYTTASIKALGQTACLGGAGNDGYRHAWSTSICVDNATSKNPISRAWVDNTAAMCSSKGGVVYTGGLCVAHSWQWMNVKAGESLPYRNTVNPVPAGYEGRSAADNLGFCYAAVRMTSLYPNGVSCPASNNYQYACAGGANLGLSCTLATQATDCPTSTCAPTANPGWTLGTDGVPYQSQASYDANLGWTWSSGQCVYAYGVKGYVNAALTRADSTTVAANTFVDFTGYTTQGDCLANGGSWDNWLPTSGGVAPGAVVQATPIATTPLETTIARLDALTPLESGGGLFYSGTGAVCQKCHTDLSRSYMERYKPGFPETAHKLAGDLDPAHWLPDGTNAASAWGLKGVQCEACHATGKPTQQDVGVIVYPNTTGTNAGLPRAASGHNQTEYGSHATGVCYYCHGTQTATSNPAKVIPVSGGDLAPTDKGLAPIANQFLNSPHAKYRTDAASWSALQGGAGSATVDVITKANYGSTFANWICRANNAIGSGSILTTAYRNGTAEKIHNLDTLTNAACTNAGDGSATSGAAGYWVRDGEAAGTANGVAYGASDQGHCMTCHDVHWAKGSAIPGAEPIRRECTTCHSHPAGEASASQAPQIDIAKINHPTGSGTPMVGTADAACESCHMPKSNYTTGAHMHLWRISTSSSYSTMGTTQVNTAADDTYPDAGWVDLDRACGQCHGGSRGSGATINGARYFSKSTLATYARNIHGSKPTAVLRGTASGLTFNADGSGSLCGGYLTNCDSFTFNWGDGTANTVQLKGSPTPWMATHAYAAPGPYTVKLTVKYLGVAAGTNRSITLKDTTPPTVAGTCAFNANTWTASVTDSATTVGLGKTVAKVVVTWGDGTPQAISTGFPVTTPLTHTYLNTGSFTVKEQVIDSAGQSTTSTLACTPAVTTTWFSIAGTVTTSTGTPIASAVVKVMKDTTLVKSVFTNASGNYTAGSLKPGTYTIVASRTGVTFGNPAPTAAIGPSATGVNVSSTVP
jgi:hypothetical protein